MHCSQSSEVLKITVIAIILSVFASSLILKPTHASSPDKTCATPNPETGKCDDEEATINSENKYSEDANTEMENDVREENNHINIQKQIKELEILVDNKIRRITDYVLAIKTEVNRVVDFNKSVEIMHEAQDRNNKDIISVSEWLTAFKKETGDKIEYIYSILQELVDYKAVSEYEMKKMKPNVQKVESLEGSMKYINKTLNDTQKLVKEIDGDVEMLLDKHSKDAVKIQEAKDMEPRISTIEDIVQRISDTFPSIQDNIDNWNGMVKRMDKDISDLKDQNKNLPSTDQHSDIEKEEFEKMNSRISEVEEQVKKFKSTSSQKTGTDDNKSSAKHILDSFKNEIEDSVKKLENKMKTAAKDIQNNKYSIDKTTQKLTDVEKEVKGVSERRTSIAKELSDFKKDLRQTEDGIRARLLEDIALQGEHIMSLIKEESDNQDRKLTTADKKIAKKMKKFEESLSKVTNLVSGNGNSLSEITTNYESHKKDMFNMVTNLQTKLESAMKELTASQNKIKKMERIKPSTEEKYMSNSTITSVFICMGVFDIILLVLILSRKGGMVDNPQLLQQDGDLDQNNMPHNAIEDTIYALSFNAKGKKLHKKLAESIFVDTNHDVTVEPLLISEDKDVSKVSSKIALVFIDNNDKAENIDELKRNTIQTIGKLGGEVFVVFVGDSGSKLLTENEIVNPKLPALGKLSELTTLVSKKRVLSIFKEFTQSQRYFLLKTFGDLL